MLIQGSYCVIILILIQSLCFADPRHSPLRLRFRPEARDPFSFASVQSEHIRRIGAPARRTRLQPAPAALSRAPQQPSGERASPLAARSQKPQFNGPITVDADGFFVDALGRRLLFHGSNSVQKSPPWVPEDMLSPEYLANLSLWGFNVMRIGIMWAGVEPQEGRFNFSYIDIMKGIVQTLGSYGMYVILDMHQDCLTSACNAYDGVPLWLIERFPKPPRELAFPWPLQQAPPMSNWWDVYFTYADAHYWQCLYRNESAAISYWARFWRVVASEFGSFENLLGYELVNEPWAGNQYIDPTIMIPGEAGARHLAPLYDHLADAIRAVDARHVIFYEPVTWSVYSRNLELGTGFERVPGGDHFRSTSALSYHYYCLGLTGFDMHAPYPSWRRMLCDDVSMTLMWDAVLGSRNRTGGGSFLTEFGLCVPDGAVNSTDTIECDSVMQRADLFLQSWTYWDALYYNSNGSVNDFAIRRFARVYPRAIGGLVKTLRFDPLQSTGYLELELDPHSSVASEIFVPERVHYARTGFEVVLVPLDRASSSYDAASQVLSLTPRPGAPTNARGLVELNVAIRPRRGSQRLRAVDRPRRSRGPN